jgi:hypothetical protein
LRIQNYSNLSPAIGPGLELSTAGETVDSVEKKSICFDAVSLVDILCRSGPQLVGLAVYPNDCPASAGLLFGVPSMIDSLEV